MSSKIPWSNLQQPGQTVGQPMVTAAAAGAAGPPYRAHWIHSIPATILQDTVTYTHKGARRAWGRIIIILLALIALGVLTAGRYLTSEDLISTRIIVRDTRTETFDEFSPTKGMCPCKEQNIQWAAFIDFKPEIKAALNNNSVAKLNFDAEATAAYTFNTALCNQILTNKSAAPPTWEQIYQETDQYAMSQIGRSLNLLVNGNFTATASVAIATSSNATNQVKNDYVLLGLSRMCIDMLVTFQEELEAENGLGFMSASALQTRDDLNSSWSAYTTDSLRRQLKAWKASYLAISSVNSGLINYYEDSCSTEQAGQDCQKSQNSQNLEEIEGIAALINITSDPKSFMQTTYAAQAVSSDLSLASNDTAASTNTSSFDWRPQILVKQFMMQATQINYKAYQSKCAPSYCDFAQSKTAFNWIAEFLSTIGGLWTIVIGIATLCWGMIGLLGLVGNEHSAFYAWH